MIDVAYPAVDSSGWETYAPEEMDRLMGRRKLTTAAKFNFDKRAASGIFLIREPKTRTAVTVHDYIDSCIELAMMLFGTLVEKRHPIISQYMTPEDFMPARDEQRFHNPRIRIDIPRLRKPNAEFEIYMQMEKVRPLPGGNGTLYIPVSVRDAVEGRLVYVC